MAYVEQYAMMRAKQEEAYQELHEVIKHQKREAREPFCHGGTKAKFDERSSGGFSGNDTIFTKYLQLQPFFLN